MSALVIALVPTQRRRRPITIAIALNYPLPSGGGWCVSDEDCYGRSKTSLGSNVNLTTTAINPAGYCGASWLSNEPLMAPGFSDWNAVYVPYCGGASYTARNATPVEVSGSTIFTRTRGSATASWRT